MLKTLEIESRVSVGTATVAMILNGLGFSNRQLYLVPQFFANKPIEHLLGAGIHAEMLNDDCLGRTLDWLYAHDPTKLFAGIAHGMRNEMTILSELNCVPTKWPILVVKVHNRLLPFIWKDGEPFQFSYSG